MVRYASIKTGYRVGDDGSVWSCVSKRGYPHVLTDRWHLLKPQPNSDGHLRVTLGPRDRRQVHRLVLEAFVGPCPEGMECRHLDGDPGNNRVKNLCWGTPKQNGEDKVRHGRSTKGEARGEENPAAVLNGASVGEVLAMYREGKRPAAIARWFHVCHGTITKILRGETWTHITGLPLARRPRRGGVT